MILLGAIQTFIGFWVFILKKPKHKSNRILAVWLLILSIILLGGLVEGGVVQYFKPGVFPLVFLFGPLLYFYIRSQIQTDFNFHLLHLFHLLPFVAVVLHRIMVSAENIDFIDSSTSNINNVVYELLMLISIVIYWIISISILVKHKQKLPDNFSYRSERLTFNWTSLIVFLNILIFTLSFLSPFLNSEKLMLDPGFVFHFNFSLFGFLLMLFGLLQPAIYSQSASSEKSGKTPENKSEKYKRSGLSNNELTKTADDISRYFEDKKPYLNPEFDLQTMAEELQLSRQVLSQTMNEVYRKNFYRLVNEYRVNTVILKMNDPAFAHLNLLGLGFESGFNSKASFNRVFK